MNKIAEFVKKKRTIHDIEKPSIQEVKVPWYKRPLSQSEFTTRKAKNGKFYVRHCEWDEKTWIGPYNNTSETDDIINSYVEESLKAPLDKKTNKNIHSIVVYEQETFFDRP